MSGSSLDGVDIAYCEFFFDTSWHYKIKAAQTIPYPEEWLTALKNMPGQQGECLIKNDISYGLYLGKLVSEFISIHKINPDIISSHGHTIFHNPDEGYTFQLGNGQAISSITGKKTIADFRIGDIQMGGQGAPLVPIGDKLLFSQYDYCINIGGIANISFNKNKERIGLDICPANQLLNHLSNQVGKPFDTNGNIAMLGKMNKQLFDNLNNHSYYTLSYPKSMSNQLVTDSFISILEDSNANIEDKLYTVCKHIAYQIKKTIANTDGNNILITGGGVHNKFLVTAIKKELNRNIIIPEKLIVDYKEAMVFAFMGALRIEEKPNCLASVTGATRDSSSGIVFLP